MGKQKTEKQRYKVRVRESGHQPGTLTFTFMPKSHPSAVESTEIAAASPQCVVDVHEQQGEMTFAWRTVPPCDPNATQKDFEEEIRGRIADRKKWIGKVGDLVEVVQQWAKELGWSTRQIEKQLDDSRIGKHKIPALILQDGTVRVLLEPVSRRVPGGEGLVDLYLMPSYEDIASLFLRDDGWRLQYVFPEAGALATEDEPEEKPLSKEVLAVVLEAMKKNAG